MPFKCTVPPANYQLLCACQAGACMRMRHQSSGLYLYAGQLKEKDETRSTVELGENALDEHTFVITHAQVPQHQLRPPLRPPPHPPHPPHPPCQADEVNDFLFVRGTIPALEASASASATASA